MAQQTLNGDIADKKKMIDWKDYSITELPEKIREKVIDKFRNINVEYEWWDWFLVEFCDEARKKGFNLKLDKIIFDLGRGEHFSIRTNGMLLIEDKIFSRKSQKSFEIYEASWDFKFPEKFSNYSECSDVEFYIYDEWERMEMPEQIKKSIRDEFYDSVHDLLKLCKNYLAMLKEEYYRLMSDETVLETLKINEYRFDENGDMV